MVALEEVTVSKVSRPYDNRFGEYDRVEFKEHKCIANDFLFSEDGKVKIFLSREMENDRSYMYMVIRGFISVGDKLKINKRKTWI